MRERERERERERHQGVVNPLNYGSFTTKWSIDNIYFNILANIK